MIRLCFLVCVMNTMAFEDSDEAKYIDLLPESEKQEFLNRIARRILEEIQSKDSPEQSHVEVTDDQLNAHDAYVQDLLKEESENHKNERRGLSDKEDNNDQLNSNPLIENGVTTLYSPQEVSENRHHIDLTLRSLVEENANNHRRFSDKNQQNNDNVDTNNDSVFSVIPVDVLYDKSGNKNDENANNKSSVFTDDDSYSGNNHDESTNIMKNSSKNDEVHLDQDKNTVSNVKYQALEKSNKATSERPEDKENSTNVLIKDRSDSFNNMEVLDSKTVLSTKSLNTDTKKIYNEEGSEADSKININTEMSKENKFNEGTKFHSSNTTSTMKQNIHNVSNKENTFIPLTTEIYLESNLSKQPAFDKDQEILSPTIKKMTVKTITESPKMDSNRTSDKEDKSYNAHNIQNNAKTHLRKRLQFLSAEYSIEEESHKNKKDQTAENNKPKEYVVYEVSKDNPAFIQKADSKKDEQPYYVPIYSFEPKHAYYNAYNNLGPNNDDELNTERKSVNSKNDVLDKELSRSGFKIDLKPKNHKFDYIINDVRPRIGKYNLPRHNMIKPKYHNVKYSPHFDLDYYFDIDDNVRLNREEIDKDKGVQRNNMDSSHLNVFKTKYTPDFHMDYFDIYTDLRRSKGEKAKRMGHKSYYQGGKLPDSSEADHPYNSIHKDDIDHVRAVKKLLFRQRAFGFLSPTPYAIKAIPRRKRVFYDSLDSNKDVITRKPSKKGVKTDNIAMDYYWGRVNNLNTSFDIDFDDNDLNNIKSEYNGYKKVNIGKTKFGVLKSIIDSLARSVGKFEISKSFDDDFDNFLDALRDVLRDMIHRDSASIVAYDWLLSTVEIRGALQKLWELTENAEKEKYIHPLDLKLLNYVVYLYDTSSNILDIKKLLKRYLRSSNDLKDSDQIVKYVTHVVRKFITLPKSKKKKLGEKIKNPLNLWQNWYKYYIRILRDENNKNAGIIKKFKRFLTDVEDGLYDIHNALKHIVSITTFPDQNWYQDLKNIFLKSATKKQLLQILLHLSASKLFNSIEESTKKGAEDYVYYAKNHREVLREIQNEFVFVLRILERLKMY